MSFSSKQLRELCEKVQSTSPLFFLQYDGTWIYKKKKSKNIINNIIIPSRESEVLEMKKLLMILIRTQAFKLDDKYLLTFDNRVIEKSHKVVEQFQIGGFDVSKGVVSNKRKKSLQLHSNLKKTRYETRESRKRKREQVEESRRMKMRLEVRVNASYSITYLTHFERYHHTQTKGGVLRDVQAGEVEGMVEQIGRDFCEVQSYETEVTNLEINTEVVPVEAHPLEEERMHGMRVNYHFLRVEKNWSDNLTCVYDYLLKKYSKLKKLTKKSLMDIFEEEDMYNGVTTLQIEKFCRKHQIGMTALDMDMKVFKKYNPREEHRNHNLPSLVFVVASKHMYPVEDIELRNQIFGTERAKQSNTSRVSFNSTVKKQQFDASKLVVMNPEFEQIPHLKDINVIYTELKSLLPLVKWLFLQEQTIYQTNSYNGLILRIKYKDNVDIAINHDYEKAVRCSNRLSIPFRNQNLIQLGMEAFMIHIEDDKVKSVFNSETAEVFLKFQKTVHSKTYYIPQQSAKLLTLDIQKCHTAAFSFENDYNWCVFNLMDEIEKYQGKLKDGCFYIETRNMYPLHGNGWYMRGLLEYSKSIGIDFEIKYQIIPSNTLPKDYFVELVQRIFRLCHSEAKIMLNCLFGSFNKKSKQSTKDSFTCSLNEAALKFTQDKNSVFFQYEDDCPGLYHITSTTKNKLFEYLIPFYWQILDNNSVMLHKLSTKMGGRIVRLKTDSVVVEGSREVECIPNTIGAYKVEDNPTELRLSPDFENDYEYVLNKRDWNLEERTGLNRLLTGFAGTGKSYRLKKDLKDLPSYTLLATTNKAARLIGGQTIHMYFGIDTKGKYDLSYAIRQVNRVAYIIIDEVSMMPYKVYEMLYRLSLLTKVKFILVGDYKQLPAVEAKRYNYSESLVLKELVEFNKEVLTVNHRNDLQELYERVSELKEEDFQNSTMTKIHICYTNAKRIKVNQMMMDRDRLKRKKTLVISKNEYDCNSQDVRLIVGCPVVAIRTKRSLRVVNSAVFTVKKLDPLTLRDNLTKDEIEIETDTFKELFYIGYCTTTHKAQGETISTPYTIWEWNRMDDTLKYTTISRASSKELINVVRNDTREVSEPDTDFEKLREKLKRVERMKDPLFKRRFEAMVLINRILRGECSESVCERETQMTRSDLLNHLGLPETGQLPKGYSLDHIRERSKHETEDDFRVINAWWNLRLLSKRENSARTTA